MAALTYILLALLVVATKANQNPIYKSNNDFSLKTYNVLCEKEEGNMVFSPMSAHASLSMLYQGAEGNTKEAISSKLDLPDQAKCADSYHDVIQDLNDSKDVHISMANKAYVDKNVELTEDFENICESKFLSGVQKTDFSQKTEACNEINEWVEDKTEHKVKDLFQPDDFEEKPDLVLVNSMYFKGSWAKPMILDRDEGQDFHLNTRDKKQVKMMSLTESYKFKDDESSGAKVLEMPFKDERYCMYFILPKEKCALDQLEAKMKSDNPPDFISNLKTEDVDVKIPPFKIEKQIEMREVLEEMGLGELFEKERCNFSGMVKDTKPLHINRAVQKVVIDVNQEGCEAGVATGMPVVPSSLPQNQFHADHPFMFCLCEKKGDDVNVLFTGRVTNPEY